MTTFARIRELLAPPVFADEEQSRTARLFNIISLAVLAGLALYTLVVAPAQTRNLPILVLAMLTVMGMQGLMRRGHVRLAGWLLAAALWSILTLAASVAGGVRSPAFGSYIVVVVVASLLAGGRAGLLFAGLSAAAGAGLVYAEANHLLPTTFHTSLTTWIAQSALFGLSAALLAVVAGDLRASLRQARREMAERKRAEEALRESEGFRRLIIETEPECVKLLAPDGRLLDMNRAGLDMIEANSLEQVQGRLLVELVAPEHRPAFGDLHERVMQGEAGRLEFEIIGLKGTRRWLETHAVPFYDPQNEISALLGITRDLTERKRMEETLRLQSAALSSAANAIFITDKSGIIQWVNEAFTRLTGYTSQEAVGENPRLLKSGKQDRAFYQTLWETVLSGNAWRGEMINKRKDGSLFIEATTIAPVLDEKGSLTHFVAIIQNITERKRMEEALRRRADEFAALYETARDLSAQHDLPTLLHIVAERAAALLAAQAGMVFLYDAGRQILECVVSRGAPQLLGRHLRLGEGMAGRVAGTRQPLVVEDYSVWEGRAPGFEDVPFTSALQVPMLYRGELIGVLDVSEIGETSRRFTEADAHLLSLFAALAAGAVHNAQLLQETRRRSDDLAAIAHVSAALRLAQTLDDMLPRLLDETLAVLATDAGAIWLYDAARDELRQAVARGWFRQINETPMRPGEGIAGAVFATGEAHLSREFAGDPRVRASTRPQLPPGWGGACVPIRAAAHVVGVFFVSTPLPRELTPEEVHLLTALAEMAGNAIHRMRLHEQTEQRLRRLQALRAIDLAVTASLNLNITLNVLLDHALLQLRVDAAAVLLLDLPTQMLTFAAGRGFHSHAIRHTRLRLGEGYAGRAALEGRIVHVLNVIQAGGDLARALLLADEAIITYYSVPLVAKGQVKGVLEIFHRAPLDPDPEWLDFLETLAGQAAIAIDNAELFESLQRSNTELALAYDATIEGWARALELRDRETEGHTRRVAELAMRLARAMGVGEVELVRLRRGALLHDIGKMGIPDSILLKPGPLTEEEWALMRQHPQHAYEMLSPIVFLRPALDIPHSHHEKWDGAGYPRGLKGEQIPLAARIFAVVDVWDALRSNRPYRPAWPEAQAREHMRSLAGTHFDPKAVEVFMRLED